MAGIYDSLPTTSTDFAALSSVDYEESSEDHEQNDDQDLLKTKAELEIRDGGYAWFVLGAMFSSNLIMSGYNRSFGILTTAMLDAYPDSSEKTTGLILGLLSGGRSIFAPVLGTLTNRFGLRRSLFFGVSLNFIALVSSFFCNSMTLLGFTMGAMVGLSQCILQCIQVILIPQYFEKNLSIANGIRVASNPLGGLLFPFLISVFIEYYSLRLTFLFLGMISAHMFIFSFLMRPIKKQMKIKAIEKTNKIYENKYYEENTEEAPLIPKYDNEVINSSEWTRVKSTPGVNIKKHLFEEIMLKNNHLLKKLPQKRLEFKFFKSLNYIMYIILAAIIPWGVFLSVYYMVIYAQKTVGLSSYQVSIMVGFEAIFDFCMRIFIGWFNNKNFWSKSYTMLICLWISSVGMLCIPFSENMIILIMLIFFCNLAGDSYITSLNVILVEDFGKEHIASTWGFMQTTSGIFSFVNSVMIGYILDWTGSFAAPFFVMSGVTFACGILVGIQILVKKFKSPNEDRS